MPSKSPAQHRLMEAVAHDPAFAKKAGIPQKVGRDFAAADKKTGGWGKVHKQAAQHLGLKTKPLPGKSWR